MPLEIGNRPTDESTTMLRRDLNASENATQKAQAHAAQWDRDNPSGGSSVYDNKVTNNQKVSHPEANPSPISTSPKGGLIGGRPNASSNMVPGDNKGNKKTGFESIQGGFAEKMKAYTTKDPSFGPWLKTAIQESGNQSKAIKNGETIPELAEGGMSDFMSGYVNDQRQQRAAFRTQTENNANNSDVPQGYDLTPEELAKVENQREDGSFGAMFESRNPGGFPRTNAQIDKPNAYQKAMEGADPIKYAQDKSGAATDSLESGIRGIPGGNSVMDAADTIAGIPGKAASFAEREIIKPAVGTAADGFIQARLLSEANERGITTTQVKEEMAAENAKANPNPKPESRPAVRGGGSTGVLAPTKPSGGVPNETKTAIGGILTQEAVDKTKNSKPVDPNADNGVVDVVKPDMALVEGAKYGTPEAYKTMDDQFAEQTEGLVNEKMMEQAAQFSKEAQVAFATGSGKRDQEDEEEDWYEDPDFYKGIGNFLMALVVSGGNILAASNYASSMYDKSKSARKRQELAPQLKARGYTPESINAYMESGNQKDLVNMSAEEKAQADTVSAQAKASGALYDNEVEQRIPAALRASMEKDKLLLDNEGKDLSNEAKYISNLDSTRDAKVRANQWSVQEEANYNLEKSYLELEGLRVRAAKGEKVSDKEWFKARNDRLTILKKLFDSGSEGRKNVTQLLFGVQAKEAGLANRTWTRNIGNTMRTTLPNGKEVNTWQSYPLSGMSGDLYNTTGEASVVRAIWDNVITSSDTPQTLSQIQGRFEKGITGSDLSDDEKVSMKRAYASEMAFLTAINGDKTLNDDAYLRLRNKFFPGTGDSPQEIANMAVKRKQAIALREDAAGKQILGESLDKKSVQRATDYYTSLDVTDWKVDSSGNDLVKISGSGAKALNDKLQDAGITLKGGQWINMDEVLTEYIYAGRDEEMLTKKITQQAIDNLQREIAERAGS